MRHVILCVLMPLAVACAQGESGGLSGEGGRIGGTTAASGTTGAGGSTATATGTTGTTGASTTGTSSGGGTPPNTCPQADGSIGCCLGGSLYYCKTGSTSVTEKSCSSGDVCGWNASKSYYDCVASAGQPPAMYPMDCP
jgi:hypothetical protein